MISQKKTLERWFCKKLQMQGAQKLRSEAQRRRWTFYKTITLAPSTLAKT
jgi:hypothetical protein